MKRLALGAVLAVLTALAVPARAENTSLPPQAQAPWYKRWFGIGPDPVVPPQPPKRDPAAEAASARAAAETDYNRRLAVCLELRQMALERNDQAFDLRVQELEQKAWELYRRQTAHLPCNRLMPSDERAVGSRLVDAPTSAVSADRLSPRTSDTGRRLQASAVREINP